MFYAFNRNIKILTCTRYLGHEHMLVINLLVLMTTYLMNEFGFHFILLIILFFEFVFILFSNILVLMLV